MEDVNFRHLSSDIMDIGNFLFSPVLCSLMSRDANSTQQKQRYEFHTKIGMVSLFTWAYQKWYDYHTMEKNVYFPTQKSKRKFPACEIN